MSRMDFSNDQKSTGEGEQITVCTIVSKNYLAHARTFTDSFLKTNPGGKVFVLLVDEIDGRFDPIKEKFELITLKEIGIENLNSFCFKYTVLEQNTSAKARFLQYLFAKYQLKKLIYSDPDIVITNSLENLWNLLEKKSIILTPHITKPIDDDKYPSELDLLRSGTYNLGFIGLSNTETSKNFLNWWDKHLMEEGYHDVEKGMMTDQKWIDLVPSIFNDVFIIKHVGYNVAYWNLMQRNVTIMENKIEVNGKPLYFFHFSGFAPEKLEQISKHQNRFKLKDLEKIKPLFEMYRDHLVENGYLDVKDWKCKFDYFDNGIKITKEMRKIFRKNSEKGINFGNPFKTSESNSLFNFLKKEIDNKNPKITHLWYQIYQDRKDLQEKFPNILDYDREEFLDWCAKSLVPEYNLDKVFVPLTIQRTSREKIFFEKSKKNVNKKFVNKENIGFNVSGYFKGAFGIAEAARSYVRGLNSVKIPNILVNVTSDAHTNDDEEFKNFETKNPYEINLIAVNADQSDVFYDKVGPEFFSKKYNIALWFWEISKFPEMWKNSFRHYDEIWVASNFVANAISKSSPIPVVKISLPILVDETKFVKNRSRFKINSEDYVFLFIFDFFSVMERKNPIGIIDAFTKAFSENDKASLIIKCINHEKFPEEFKKLEDSIAGKNIRILAQHMDKSEILSLIASCDCYVSLHRSEGFGLTIAEAMYAKKPVIATSYGGNVDFMNLSNSFPVKYEIVELKKDHGAYSKGNEWANPSIEHASSIMRKVFENPKLAKEIGEKAYNFVKTRMSPQVAGKEIQFRLNVIKNKNS